MTHLYVGAARWAGESHGGLFWRDIHSEQWREADLPQPVQVHAVAVHPADRAVVFAGTDRGLFRSRDGGHSWQALPTPSGLQIWSVYFHPGQVNTLFAGTSPVGVLRSQDGGSSWTPMQTPLPERVRMAFPCRVMRFTADPQVPGHFYAALEVGGAMRSRNDGESWEDCAEDLVRLARDNPALRSRIQSDSDTEGMLDAHALCMTPASPGRVILAARMGLFDSLDGGTTWRDMGIGRFSTLTYARDILVSRHDARVIYACLSPASRSEDGRLYRSCDAAMTWERIDRGICPRATMMAVAEDPDTPLGLHCIARCGQVFSTSDGGQRWTESPMPPGVRDIYAIACG